MHHEAHSPWEWSTIRELQFALGQIEQCMTWVNALHDLLPKYDSFNAIDEHRIAFLKELLERNPVSEHIPIPEFTEDMTFDKWFKHLWNELLMERGELYLSLSKLQEQIIKRLRDRIDELEGR